MWMVTEGRARSTELWARRFGASLKGAVVWVQVPPKGEHLVSEWLHPFRLISEFRPFLLPLQFKMDG